MIKLIPVVFTDNDATKQLLVYFYKDFLYLKKFLALKYRMKHPFCSYKLI